MQASGLNKLTSHDIIGVWHADLRCKGDNISSNSINSQAVTLSKLVAAFPWMGCCSGLPDHPGEKAISTSSGRPVEVETADGVQKVLIAPASYCYCLLISSAATFVPEIWKDSGWLSVATPFLLGPFPFFFFRIFWGQKNFVERQKWLISSHAKVDVRTKDAFSKNHLFGAWSLLFGPKFDLKKDPRWGTKRSTVVEYLLSTIRSGVSLDELSCYCVILWYRKISANCWVSNLWSTDSSPSGISAAFWRISLQNNCTNLHDL